MRTKKKHRRVRSNKSVHRRIRTKAKNNRNKRINNRTKRKNNTFQKQRIKMGGGKIKSLRKNKSIAYELRGGGGVIFTNFSIFFVSPII